MEARISMITLGVGDLERATRFYAEGADPDGHLWEVAYNPFTWIGPPPEAASAG